VNDQSKFNPIRDFALLASIISAFLYAVGYLYESAYLEGFDLNGAELSPDIPTSISFGFRYIFINTTSGIIIVSMVAFFSLLVFDQVKQDFVLLFSEKNRFSDWVRSVSKKIKLNKIKVYFLIASPFLLSFVLFHSINKGGELVVLLKKEEMMETVVVSKSGREVNFVGKVVRIRDGMVVFWDKASNVTNIFNLKNVISISYSNHDK
jgi:hypothetical protein